MNKVSKIFISLVFVLGVSGLSLAANSEEKKKDEKIYTHEDFRKAVEKEVSKSLAKMGRKEIVNLSRELLAKEESLRLQELEVEKQKQALELTRKDLNKQIKKFKDRQSKLLSCLDDVDNKKNKRIQHMVDVISGMRPQSAAEVLSVQDAEISVQILGMLESTKVSKIFNKMEKEISARLQKQYMNMKK